jgi:glycosyltransferase involved in cell wall biosynthesis
VREYVEAAKRVKNLFPGTEFILAGFVEPLHRRAILQKELKEWDLVGAVSYVGSVSDVRPLLARADCIVLPSYYKEGTPRILLEAGAMGRALITTDLPGCRDTVEDGVSGYLCEPRSIDSLVEAIMLYCSLSELERREMSKQSRQRISENFSVSIVIRKYLLAIENALSRDLNNTG